MPDATRPQTKMLRDNGPDSFPTEIIAIDDVVGFICCGRRATHPEYCICQMTGIRHFLQTRKSTRFPRKVECKAKMPTECGIDTDRQNEVRPFSNVQAADYARTTGRPRPGFLC